MLVKERVQMEKNHDWRLTTQRLAILDYLRANKTHPVAEDIHHAVKRKMPRISFGTIYRNLDFLRSHGYIKEFVVNKVSRYESRVDSHVHLVCERCGSITDLPDKRLVHDAKRLTAQQRFYAKSDNLEIRGLCASCQKKMPIKERVSELFCMACGELLDDLEKDAPVCRTCCFKTNCTYYAKPN